MNARRSALPIPTALADMMKGDWSRETMLRVAEGYERMARRIVVPVPLIKQRADAVYRLQRAVNRLQSRRDPLHS